MYDIISSQESRRSALGRCLRLILRDDPFDGRETNVIGQARHRSGLEKRGQGLAKALQAKGHIFNFQSLLP